MSDLHFVEASTSLLKKFKGRDLSRFATIKGLALSCEALQLPLYGELYSISPDAVLTPGGEVAPPAIGVLLLSYVLTYPDPVPQQGKWITFRELSGAGPLSGHLTENTNKIITSNFSGKSDLLTSRAMNIGGAVNKGSSGYDLSMIFTALPGVDVQLTFNDKEDVFPAQCSLLFRESAECFLGLKLIGILATLLTGRLIQD